MPKILIELDVAEDFSEMTAKFSRSDDPDGKVERSINSTQFVNAVLCGQVEVTVNFLSDEGDNVPNDELTMPPGTTLN